MQHVTHLARTVTSGILVAAFGIEPEPLAEMLNLVAVLSDDETMEMALRDLLTQIDQLSLEEQLTLLEALARRIRSTVHTSPVAHLRGILHPEGKLPTDEALKQDYIDYLDEKYR